MITYWRLVGRNKWVNLQLGALAAIASSPCSCSFIWLEGSAKEFELIILYFIYWVGKICERNWFDLVPDRARLWIEHSLGSGSDLNAILAQDLTHLDRSFLLVPSLSHPLLNQGEFSICFAGVCHLILLEDVHFISWSWFISFVKLIYFCDFNWVDPAQWLMRADPARNLIVSRFDFIYLIRSADRTVCSIFR